MKNNTQKVKGSSRRTLSIVLIVFACLQFASFPFLVYAARTNSFKWGGADILGGLFCLFVGVPCLAGGIHMLKTADWDEIWETRDEAKTDRLVRRISRIRDDKKLLELGGKAGLDAVADKAFSLVRSQPALCNFVCTFQGNKNRTKMALTYLKDEAQLDKVVYYRGAYYSPSEDVRLQAVEQIQDFDHVMYILQHCNPSSEFRKGIYRHLYTLAVQQGRDTAGIDRMMAQDRGLAALDRAAAYSRLQAVGLEGNRMLAEDTSMPVEMRLRAYEWLGEGAKAEQLRRVIARNCLFNRPGIGKAGSYTAYSRQERTKAACQILDSGDEAWIAEVIRDMLNNVPNPDTEMTNFLVGAAQDYPDLLRTFWPQLKRYAHNDSTRHQDGHFDSIHSDSWSTISHTHSDGKSYSDCAHSDVRNENVHTDDAGNYFLNKFPAAIKD